MMTFVLWGRAVPLAFDGRMDNIEKTGTPTTTSINRMPSPPQALYGLGIIGAWVWFWQAAEGFGEHVWAIVQGVFWPAYLVYDALGALRG